MKRLAAAILGVSIVAAHLSAAAEETTTNRKHLRALNFVIGEWVAEGVIPSEDPTELAGKKYVYCENNRWLLARNAFLVSWELTPEGGEPISGKILTGWHTAIERFDRLGFASDGGHAKGTGIEQGKGVVFTITGADGEGQEFSRTTTVTPIDEDSFSIQVTDRVIDGKSVPKLDVVMKRKKKPN